MIRGVFETGFLLRHSKRLKVQIAMTYTYRQILQELLKKSGAENTIEITEFETTGWISMRKWWTGISIAIIIIGCIITCQIIFTTY